MFFAAVLALVITTISVQTSADEECSRSRSKLVRKYIQDELLDIYTEHSYIVPSTCKWHLDNDMYGTYEDNKYMEGAAKWVCQFCGKGFYEERFLDVHFQNRHPQFLKQLPQHVCFANYCDIFRCEVFLKKRSAPRYWDKALCKEKTLIERKAKCETLLKLCVPSDIEPDKQDEFYMVLHKRLCKFLSCDYFWDLPSPEPLPLTIASYVFGWMMVSMVMFVYYFITCTHFFTDDSLLDPHHRQRVDPSYKMKFYIPEGRRACSSVNKDTEKSKT